jgi:heme exporter protein C
MKLPFAWEHMIGLLGLTIMVVGQYLGLFYAPPEAMMGDVARILYVHIPAAWLSMFVYTICAAAALTWLLTGRMGADHLIEAACEVGCVLNILLLILGSIFAKPTWGVFWTWDPRITTSTVMLLSFVAILLLRSTVNDADKRATWSAAAAVMAWINIPVTYMSVRWWASLHQMQSSPESMSKIMVTVLHVNNLAFLLITVWFLIRRWRIAQANWQLLAAPPLEEVPT